MAKMKNQSGRRVVYAFLILLGFFLVLIGMEFIGNIESGRLSGYKDQEMMRAYSRVESEEVWKDILRLADIFSSESFRQADTDVQSSATATLKEFLLQLDPALDKAKQTGKTGYLGLLRARMRNDKDMVILYLRDLGLLQDGTSKGE